ncbi:protein FAM221A [Xiphophorus hellerii]|uniref:protein FAM221A n=1 Tax=Xiphophorus hellerii TaxID=8084 RepID=UPI0013B42F5E|nr:protein FAM221A-like [Xiphophorus hellerii]XP_032437404.1 protein FAM221A-like [Xiphophorus hellerii]
MLRAINKYNLQGCCFNFMIMTPVNQNKTALEAVDDYAEYRRIVGDDDGGKLFTPEEYEEYKRRVLPLRMKNRLYVSFGVPGGIDCKQVGPETQCFCEHRYKQHQTEFEVIPSERPIALRCKVSGCRCSSYNYIPQPGGVMVRCKCKHLPQDHSEAAGHMCKKCKVCSGFHSPYTCGCGRPTFEHRTLVETKQERLARGQPVGKDVPYAAMGGLTGFTSLLDGYLAMHVLSAVEGREDDCLERSSAARNPNTSARNPSTSAKKPNTSARNPSSSAEASSSGVSEKQTKNQ